MQDNDLKGQLSKLLEDPEALSRAISLAGSLMGNLDLTGTQAAEGNADSDSVQASVTEHKPDTDGTPSKSGDEQKDTPLGIDLGAALPAIANIMGKDKKNDPRTNLLYALKPYMGSERAEKIDMLVKAMRLADIAGGFIGSGGLF